MKNKMKILCLGNRDNLGIRTYLWLAEAGYDVQLYRVIADEDPMRSNPCFYLDRNQLQLDPAIKCLQEDLLQIRNYALRGGDIIDQINQYFDVVLVAGGWHALLMSRKIKKPKIFIPVGSEVHSKAREYPGLPKISKILTDCRGSLRNHFYGWLTRNSLNNTTKILDWFPVNVAIEKRLGLGNKIIYMAFGEDVRKNSTLVNKSLLAELNAKTASSKRVFLWLSRVNFQDPNKANYKGADLFLNALAAFEHELKQQELMVFIGLHGEEKEAFKAFAKQKKFYPLINWVEHLDYPDLLAYLAINNAVLFPSFGAINAGISGISRDGYTMGVPLVNSATDKVMIQQYAKPGPRRFVQTEAEIVATMREFLVMPKIEFKALQDASKAYGENYIDKHYFIQRLGKEIAKLV
jgi:hypothetical protein